MECGSLLRYKKQSGYWGIGLHLSQGAFKACQALIEAVAQQWHNEEGNYRDDIPDFWSSTFKIL
jgi:hypothetical protein